MKIVQLDAPGADTHIDELAQLLAGAHAAGMGLGLPATLDAVGAYRDTEAVVGHARGLGLRLLWLTTHEGPGATVSTPASPGRARA